MKLRDWLNNNSAVVTILAVVILILSLGFIIMQASGPKYKAQIVDVYYYDLGNGTIFTAKSNEIPPIESKSGPGPAGNPQGVRAYVFSCGDCKNESERFVGWLEMYTREAKEMMQSPNRMGPGMPPPPGSPNAAPGSPAAAPGSPAAPAGQAQPPGPEFFDFWEKGHLVRTVEEDSWVQANSPEGFAIMQALQGKCGQGAIPKPCFPGR